MANLLISTVGAAVGFAIGGPAGAQYGWAIGSLVAGATQKGKNQEGPRLGDLRVQGSEYGAAFPWVVGAPRLTGQVVWASTKREIANTEKVGKGGGSKVTTFTYEVDLLIVFTENITDGVSRLWLNNEMVYNGQTKEGVWNGLTIYSGREDQLPDPTYEAAVGVGQAPAYRGRTSIMIRGLQLGNSGQIPNIEVEVGVSFGFNARRAVDFNSPAILSYDGTYPGNAAYWLRQYQYQDDVNGAIWTVWSMGAPGPYPPADAAKNSSGISGGELFIEPYQTVSSFSHAYMRADPSPDFVFTGDFTIAFRVKRAATGSEIYGTGSTMMLLTCVPDQTLTTGGGWKIFVSSTRLHFLATFADPVGLVSDTDIFPDRDVYYAVRIEREGNTGRMYVDDVLVATQTSANWIGATSGSYFVTLGAAASGQYFIPNDYGTAAYYDDLYLAEGIVRPPELRTNTVSDVCVALLARAGYQADEYDVSGLDGLTSVVRGMALGQVSTTRGPLETLQTAYFFEPSKSDKLYLRARPTEPIVTIPFDDLGVSEDASSDNVLALTVGNELEIPSQVSVSFANMAADYAVGTEHSDRIVSSQETNQVIQLGIGLLPEEGKGIADAILFDQIASLTRTTVRLPLKYAYLEPGDPFILVNRDGREYRVRSQAKKDDLIILEHECVLDDANALVSARVTAESYALVEAIIEIAPTIWEALDIPLLRDVDNQAGFYFAVTPNRAAPEDQWPGAVAVRAWTPEAFEQLFVTGEFCVMGYCSDTLGGFSGGSGRYDEGSSVTVRVTGELASTTRTDMLNDLSINAAVVGDEIIRFRLAEFIGTTDGENEYRLTGLLRGQRGTEQHIGTHVAAERFVLLTGAVRRVLGQTSELNVPSSIKAVTLNTLLANVPAETFTDTGVSLRPFSVANLRVLADGADLVLTWNRRTRLSYRYGGTAGVVVPLGETTEAYVVQVYNGATLVNEYTCTDGTYTYLAADITADGFTSTDPITFVVSQISELVGQGFPATVEGTAP